MKNNFKSASSWFPYIILMSFSCYFVDSIKCPDKRQCYCFGDDQIEYKIHCTTNDTSSFELTVQPNDKLKIECNNNPKWSDFLYDSMIQVGQINTLIFTSCKPPSTEIILENTTTTTATTDLTIKNNNKNENLQPEDNFSFKVARLLGAHGIETLLYQNLAGPLASHDLAAYPDLKFLRLSNNDIRNVSRDLLKGAPNLRLLDLRNTNIEIGENFFQYSSQLKTLELGQNNIESIEDGTFSGLKSIELLNLWKNNLKLLSENLFENLQTLQSLDLNKNLLQTLPKNIFKNLINLKYINLSLNNLTELPEELFKYNSKLKAIKLFHNQQNLTQLPPKLFSNLQELKDIKLTRIGLLTLPNDLFWNSTNIQNLTIDRNYLQTLPVDIFQDLYELYILNLAFNDIQKLPDNLFRSTKKLMRLDLSKNHLTSITEHMLIGLESLTELNMEENNLKFIHRDAFIHLKNLRIARFAKNQLTLRTDIYDIFGQISPFHHAQYIEELYLSHNNITEMFADWIITDTNLRVLDLKYNALNFLQAQDFQFVTNSINVDLQYNNISRLILSMLESMSSNQSAPRDVIINIENNPINCGCEVYDFLRYLNGEMHPYVQNFVHIKVKDLTCYEPEDAIGLKVGDLKFDKLTCKLENLMPRPGDPCAANGQCECYHRPYDRALLLNCSDRNLDKAPEWIETKNVAKVELHLQRNNLKEAPAMNKQGYEKVEKLDLSHNKIEAIDERVLSPNLQELKLNNNNLKFIDSKILQKWTNSSRITKLTLDDNLWNCDCTSRDLLSFVQTNYHIMKDLRKVRCLERNIPLADLSIDELCPTNSRLIIIISSAVSLFCLLLGCALALYFRFQRQIKVWLYSKNLCLCWVTEDEIDKDKLYDAFISYSHKDEDFVIKELVSRLEESPKPYKICIHTRDWLAGEWIPTQIARSVEESRRTIVILSKSFIESIWGRMEFQAAHKQALSEKRARVIIIIYGEIGPTKDLDPELRAYIQMNTYLKWGDPWFWQKLKYAMPHSTIEHIPEAKKIENMINMSEFIAEKKAATEAKFTVIDELKKPTDGFMEVVKEMNKNFSNNFEFRGPQCTTV